MPTPEFPPKEIIPPFPQITRMSRCFSMACRAAAMPSIRVVWRTLVRRFTSCGVVLRRRVSSAGRTLWVIISLSNSTLADKLAGSSVTRPTARRSDGGGVSLLGSPCSTKTADSQRSISWPVSLRSPCQWVACHSPFLTGAGDEFRFVPQADLVSGLHGSEYHEDISRRGLSQDRG